MKIKPLITLALLASTPTHATNKRVQTLSCPDKTERPRMDCSTDLGLKKKVMGANLSIAGLPIGGGARYEEYAAGQITDTTYQHALALERLCKEYNSCVLSGSKYQAESDRLRRLLERHVELVNTPPVSVTPGTIWANATGVDWADQVQLTYRIEVSKKDTGASILHQSGMVLKTGDAIRFHVQVKPAAHVYIVLHSSQNDVLQLFPDPATGQNNPLSGDQPVIIPAPGMSFKLDEFPGTETLYIMASKTQIADMETRMGAIAADSDQGLVELVDSMTSVLNEGPGGVRNEGWTTRGLQLQNADAGTTFTAIPKDDVVVIRHRIVHD